MSNPQSKEPSEAKLPSRQREWPEHLRSGETLRDQAAGQGRPAQSIYQAGKRLRRRAVIEPRVRRRCTRVH